jgi:sulfofructose kinase
MIQNGHKSMQIDVLCVGLATYDLVYSVDRHPEAETKCFASSFLMCGGGPAANAAVTVARLGGSAAFAGYLGRDIFGDMHLEELLCEGVITSLVVRDEKRSASRYPGAAKRLSAQPGRGASPSTPLSSIIVKPDGKRTVVTHKGSTPVLEPDQVDFTQVRPRAILFDGHQPAISVPLAKKAREQNIPTVLDAGSVHEGTMELAPLCGYLAASEKFARDLSGGIDPAKALGFLARIAPVAIITLGEAGLIWAAGAWEPGPPASVAAQTFGGGREGEELAAAPWRRAEREGGSIEAFPVDAVDTTGAGDIFHGAFALRIAGGEELLSALRYASAAAALGCAKMGARAAIPTRAEVEEFLIQ